MPDLTVSSAVDTFLQAADAAAMRTSLGLAAGTQGGLMWQSTDGSNPIPAWSSKWTLNTSGTLTGGSDTVLRVGDGTESLPGLSFASETNSGVYKAGPNFFVVGIGGARRLSLTTSLFGMETTYQFGWYSSAHASMDVRLARDAAGALAQRNGTNAQTFRVYNTYTDASNYERGFMSWGSNVLKIGTEKAGTGSARALELQTDGTTALTISTDQRARFADGSEATPSISFANDTGFGLYRVGSGNLGLSVGGSRRIVMTTGVFAFSNAVELGWYSSGFASMDVRLVRDAAGILALRNGANPQTFRVYNTYTSSTDYELGCFKWDTNVLKIGTEKGSGGGTARALELVTDGTTRLTISSTGTVTAAATVVATTYEFGIGSAAQFVSNGANGTIWKNSGANMFFMHYTGTYLRATGKFGWASGNDATGTADVILERDAAGILAQRNGLNAQTFRVYNTYTSSTNNEYATLGWETVGNFFVIRTVAGSAGGSCRGVAFGAGDSVGSNFTGADTYIYGGAGTGVGTPGKLYLQTASTTGSGSTAQTRANRMTIDSGITANALLTISGGLTFSDANNVITNATTGTKICTATTQKLAFWNATPVAQPASASQAAVTDTAGASYTAAEQTMLANLKTLVNQLRADLVTIGLIKGAA